VGTQLRKLESMRTYLHTQCTNNQQFFKNSEEAEFFAPFCLVFNIFFRNFKIDFSESYKTKTYNVLKKYILRGRPAMQSKKQESNLLAVLMH